MRDAFSMEQRERENKTLICDFFSSRRREAEKLKNEGMFSVHLD